MVMLGSVGESIGGNGELFLASLIVEAGATLGSTLVAAAETCIEVLLALSDIDGASGCF